ncbi:TPA: glycosyltransferase family 2 protein [Escherichia coli]
MNNNVLAIIVLYNPNFSILNSLINSVINQVRHVCIVDNTTTPDLNGINNILMNYADQITYLPFYENLGIATAQNRGIEWAKKKGFEHVLLLDQDSLLPSNMINNLLFDEQVLINKGFKVAAIGPSFEDNKTKEVTSAVEAGIFRTKKKINFSNDGFPLISDYIISSGSLIRISVLDKMGYMKENLFIDWVDIEWGERCRNLGYYSFISQKVIMQHSIGDEHVKFLGKTIYLHSDFRNYFIVRNAVYLSKNSMMRWKLRCVMLLKTPYYILLFSLFSQRKFYSLKLLSRAALDGAINRMGKGYFR